MIQKYDISVSTFLELPCFYCRRMWITYQVDEDVHDTSKVSDDSSRGEEQTVGHYLQIQLDAHKDDKHVLSDL